MVLESATSKEAVFIDLLLKGYDNSIRPVIDETTVTNVTIIPNSLSVLLMVRSYTSLEYIPIKKSKI